MVGKGLLEDLVEQGIDPGRRRLFVIDGSKALRKAIDMVFGSGNPRGFAESSQRCRNYKIENVTGHLPKELKGQVKAVMRGAYRLEAAEGNLAWVAWREGDVAAALEHGAKALEVWEQRPVPFWWTALWPLTAVALERDDVPGAVGYARSLLEPTQQRLPDALTEALEQTIEAWDAGDSESARKHLGQALELAQESKCL